jgi:uncharacterized membrane protein
MTDVIYHLTAFGAFVITGVTLRHAWGDGERIAFLGTAIAYGFLIEKATMVVFGMHSYPTEHFLFPIWSIPVSVPLVWGVIMYASLMAGRHLGLQHGGLSVFAGLFALHIALAIDVIAVRIPLWTWHLSGVWFDVPVVNFVGWYSVALLFTGSFLVLGDELENDALAGLISIAASTVVLLVIVATWLALVAPSARTEVVLFVALLVVSLLYLVRMEVRPGRYLDRFPAETVVSVLLIHLFYLQASLYYGYYRELPVQLYISIAMLLAGIAVYYIPYTTASAPEVARRYRETEKR